MSVSPYICSPINIADTQVHLEVLKLGRGFVHVVLLQVTSSKLLETIYQNNRVWLCCLCQPLFASISEPKWYSRLRTVMGSQGIACHALQQSEQHQRQTVQFNCVAKSCIFFVELCRSMPWGQLEQPNLEDYSLNIICKVDWKKMFGLEIQLVSLRIVIFPQAHDSSLHSQHKQNRMCGHEKHTPTSTSHLWSPSDLCGYPKELNQHFTVMFKLLRGKT